MRPTRLAVANKLVDAAANNNENLARLSQDGAGQAQEQIRVIWTSPLIPSDPLVWRKDLDADLKKKISTSSSPTARRTRRRKKVLAGSRLGAIQEVRQQSACSPSARWRSTRPIAKIKADAKLSEADKREQIAPLQKQFDELGKQIAAMKK